MPLIKQEKETDTKNQQIGFGIVIEVDILLELIKFWEKRASRKKLEYLFFFLSTYIKGI